MQLSEKDWKARLTPEQFRILRAKGTEAPFSGTYVDNKEKGVYRCVACNADLFMSDHKFDSGTGWPSFYDVARSNSVALKDDISHGMRRVEVLCKKCGGHLGHVFDDAHDQPGGKRYCINSGCLAFVAKNQ